MSSSGKSAPLIAMHTKFPTSRQPRSPTCATSSQVRRDGDRARAICTSCPCPLGGDGLGDTIRSPAWRRKPDLSVFEAATRGDRRFEDRRRGVESTCAPKTLRHLFKHSRPESSPHPGGRGSQHRASAARRAFARRSRHDADDPTDPDRLQAVPITLEPDRAGQQDRSWRQAPVYVHRLPPCNHACPPRDIQHALPRRVRRLRALRELSRTTVPARWARLLHPVRPLQSRPGRREVGPRVERFLGDEAIRRVDLKRARADGSASRVAPGPRTRRYSWPGGHPYDSEAGRWGA